MRVEPEKPFLTLIRQVVKLEGWVYLGGVEDPPPAPPGFFTETKEDGFLGFVSHYRFVALLTPEVERLE